MATNAPKSAPKNAPRNAATDDPSVDDAPKPKKSKKKLIFILIVALLLLGGGGGGAWWYFADNEETPEGTAKPKAKKTEAPIYVNLEQFTVNLQSEGSEHFLQVVMALQVGNKEEVELIKQYMPVVRGRILLLLSSKKKSELLTTEGKTKLSTEILAQVNQPFTPDSKPQTVSSVHFTTFIVQ